MKSSSTRILLVDAAANEARRIGELLGSPTEYQLVFRDRIGPALQCLRDGEIDVILLGSPLPDAQGLNALVRVQRADRRVPVIVITTAEDPFFAAVAMRGGAQDYLVKSELNGSLLRRAIRYAIERKRGETNLRRLLREQSARAEIEAAERRSRFLAEASRVLATSLDLKSTLRALANLVAPILGDLCIVDVMQDERKIMRVISEPADPEKAELVRRLHRRPADRKRLDEAVTRAIRVGAPFVDQDRDTEGSVEDTDPRGIQSSRSEITGEFDVSGIGQVLRSLLTVPLMIRGQALGALSFSTLDERRAYGAEDLALAEDLSQRVGLAIENARLYEEAQQAARGRDEMLSIVSHDLRNPLTVITMAAGNLRHIGAALGATAFRNIEKIERSSQRMVRLLEDLLEVTRVESGMLRLERMPHDVSVILSEALDLMQPIAQGKDLRLERHVDTELPPVLSDRDRVVQIFSNLIGNAVKFTPEGGRIAVQAERNGDGVRFSVQDSGLGIAPEELPHVFDRFWQSRQARAASKKGAGLGLAIARGIVEAHGGRLWVESRLGEGTTFFFTLPGANVVPIHGGAARA